MSHAHLNSIDWQAKIVRYLAAAGTVGRSQTEILRRVQHEAPVDMVVPFLEALLGFDKVQKFEVPIGKSNRNTIIWRATTKLLEKGGLV